MRGDKSRLPSSRTAVVQLLRQSTERDGRRGVGVGYCASMTKLSKAEQDQIVVELAVGVETLPQEEFDDLYQQLDVDHQIEADQNLRNFADTAVGDPNWDADEKGFDNPDDKDED